jgi:hypothetical protein
MTLITIPSSEEPTTYYDPRQLPYTKALNGVNSNATPRGKSRTLVTAFVKSFKELESYKYVSSSQQGLASESMCVEMASPSQSMVTHYLSRLSPQQLAILLQSR